MDNCLGTGWYPPKIIKDVAHCFKYSATNNQLDDLPKARRYDGAYSGRFTLVYIGRNVVGISSLHSLSSCIVTPGDRATLAYQ